MGGGELGNWCVNCIDCILPPFAEPWPPLCEFVVIGAAVDCIVVRVVVKDRTDGAGDENVLSAP